MDIAFKDIMQLEAHGPDTYVGTGPRYPWDGLYGGQVVAQALCAAKLTVKAGYLPHSLHANFLRMGDASEPVRYEVERLRDGASFFARQVVARQSTGAILNMSATFRLLAPPTMDVQVAVAPDTAGPGEGQQVSWSRLFDMRAVAPPTKVPGDSDNRTGTGNDGRGGGGRGRGRERDRDREQTACSWFRLLEDLGDDPTGHAAALAFISDSGPARLVSELHETSCKPDVPWRPLSLDHAIWYHRPFRSDEWLLLQTFGASLYNSSGLATGRVFSQDGALVASIAQEVLLRQPRGDT